MNMSNKIIKMNEKLIKTENNPLVSICCLAYNHEPYIRQCLDGFMMQKTDFPFEVLIHDDASTDKTADIIREYEVKYPDIIKPIYQTENQYSKGVGIFKTYQFPSAKGKYMAFCEGDDYWTDPLKLQKQVDFLEKHEDFAICFHPVKILKEPEKTIIDDYITDDVPDVTDIYTLAKGNYIHTPSIVFRKNEAVLNQLNAHKFAFGDYPLLLFNAQYGKICRLPDFMAIYRKHRGGILSKLKQTDWLNLLEQMKNHFSYDKKMQQIFSQQYAERAFLIYNMYKNKHDGENAKLFFEKSCKTYPDVAFNEFQKLECQIQNLRRSKAYKLGKFLLAPIRKLQSL